jgi:hypothetical protein
MFDGHPGDRKVPPVFRRLGEKNLEPAQKADRLTSRDRRRVPSRGHCSRCDRSPVGGLRLGRAEPIEHERRRRAGRRGVRVSDRLRAGRLRALHRSAALRRHRGKARGYDIIRLLRASRALHGRSARVSGPGSGQVRFEYVASLTEILFRDHADPASVSRRVFAFHRPETFSRRLKEPGTLRRSSSPCRP